MRDCCHGSDDSCLVHLSRFLNNFALPLGLNSVSESTTVSYRFSNYARFRNLVSATTVQNLYGVSETTLQNSLRFRNHVSETFQKSRFRHHASETTMPVNNDNCNSM